MKKDCLLAICQPVIQVMNVGEDVRMCERGAFGGTGRSTRVQEHKDRVRIVKFSGVWLAFDFIKRIDVDHEFQLKRYGRRGELRMPDEATRAGILEEPVNLGADVTRVDGNCDDAKQAAGIDQFYVFRTIRHQESQPLSTQEAATPESRGNLSYANIEFLKGHGPAFPQQSCVLREVLQGATNGVGVNHRSISLENADLLNECAEARDSAANDEGVHLPRSFVGVDRFGISDETANVVIKKDSIGSQ